MARGLNKFLHGTLWSWAPGEHALIISSDEHNMSDAEVNCVSVIGISDDDEFSIDNIKCTQIHTVEKAELSVYQGAVPAPVLAAVKARIRKQLNMGDDKNLHDIQETAAKLISQLAQLDSEYVPPVSSAAPPAPHEPHPLNEATDMAADAGKVEVAPNDVLLSQSSEADSINSESDDTDKPAVPKKQKKPPKKPRDKKVKSPDISPRTGKPKREMRSYTDEDEAFVLDEKRSAEEIMERFGFTEKRKVADLKFLLKKRREKRKANQ